MFARLPNSYYRTQVVTADAEIPSADRHPHGLGLTDGWREEANGVGRLVLSAYGHVLSLSPFVLSDDEIVPIMLERAATKDAYSGAKSSGYSFPEDAQWFGCLVSLLPEGGSAPEPEMDCYRSDREVEVAAAGGLSIRLFLQPSGELTELHEEDWRTTPLLDCPTGVLWPGQLAERAAIQNSGPG